MGVLRVSDDLPVWSGGSRIIYSIIMFAIDVAGERPYLVKLRTSFDHGYNHADLSLLEPNELTEFRQIAAAYAQRRLWKREGFGDCEDSMKELLGLITARLGQLTRH